MATGQSRPEADPLHPLASLNWKHCHTPPWRYNDNEWPVDCVALHDRVAIRTDKVISSFDVVYVSSTDLNSWTSSRLPYQCMSLTAYKSKFIAVGGVHFGRKECSNKLFTSDTGLHWDETLPPMETKRYWVSSVSTKCPEVLVVAGGKSSDNEVLDVVEVLVDDWTTVRSLPAPCFVMRSAFHDGNLYFIIGGLEGGIVCTCSCSSLILSKNDTSLGTPVWNIFEGPAWCPAVVSYSSRLVCIDGWCNIRAYSSEMESWLKATRTGQWSDQGGMEVAAGVLPTGEIVYAHQYGGIYLVKLHMSSFDLDSQFVSNVLSRLGAVTGIDFVSRLADYHQQLTTASGVTLQTRQDEVLPNPDMEPCQYVEEVISQWSAGHSCRPSTWRQLLEVLRDIGLPKLSQLIDIFVEGVTRYMKAYHYFIDNKESVALLFLKFLLLGPPQVGKSTTLRRLMGKIVDLKSAGEEDWYHSSTGAIESGAVLVRSVSNTTALITQSEWSAVENVGDEAHMLIHSLINALTSPSNAAATSSSIDVPVAQSTSSVAESTSSVAESTSSVAESTSSVAESTSSVAESTSLPAPPAVQATRQPQESSSLWDILDVLAMFKKAMGSKNWKDAKQMFKAYLRVEDTGGQPELMDMLPTLTIGPGLYLLFINLQNHLDHHYKLTYCDKSGTKTPPVESVYNIKEMLFSSLASIRCSCASSPMCVLAKDESIIPGVSDILKTSKSKAYIVGTHKDQVTEDHIKELNKQLRKIVESTEFSDIVEYFSQDELIVAMDNMAGGVEEVKKFQESLERCMARCFTDLRIPVVWLLFSLILQMKKERTVSLKDCMRLSGALDMSSYETEVALWFLHHHAGVLMYFPNIPELNDLVIIDIQVVYDSITSLIQNARNGEKVGVHAANKFKKMGKFTIAQLTAIMPEAGDFIPIQKLVVLLKYLHIIAPITSDQKMSSSSEEEVTYIMPCVLDSANKEDLDAISRKPHKVCPIMVRFKCGFVPIGIFPALIACLINNHQSFFVIESGIKKNIVQFHYGVHRTLVTFLCRSMYYEFIAEIIMPEIEVHKECSALRREIEDSFDHIFRRMNYGALVEYDFAFACPIHTMSGDDHLCVVNRAESSPVMMDCLQNTENKIPVRLTDQRKLWYGQADSISQDICDKFRKEFDRLKQAISSSVTSVGSKCYSMKLISRDTLDYILLTGVETSKQALKIMKNVEEVISCDSQAIFIFLDILDELGICDVSELRNTLH